MIVQIADNAAGMTFLAGGIVVVVGVCGIVLLAVVICIDAVWQSVRKRARRDDVKQEDSPSQP